MGLRPVAVRLDPLERPAEVALALGGDCHPLSFRLLWIVLPLLVLLRLATFPDPVKARPATTAPASYVLEEDLDMQFIREHMVEAEREEALRRELDPNYREMPEVDLEPTAPEHLRMAAVQFYSEMGKPEKNRERLVPYIREAAKLGARIVVLPECAIPGYADAENWVFWRDPQRPLPAGEEDEEALKEYLDVTTVAEPYDGESYRFFRPLAQELKIYLTVPYIEKADGNYYDSVSLLNPAGEIILRYRKRFLWAHGDPSWATPGDSGAPVAETPYGRVGVMISYDMHKVLPELAEKNVDIVLHCAALYGMNFEAWLVRNFQPRMKHFEVNLVLANWAYPYTPTWNGYGLSRIIDRNGKLVAARPQAPQSWLVVNDVPVAADSSAAQSEEK